MPTAERISNRMGQMLDPIMAQAEIEQAIGKGQRDMAFLINICLCISQGARQHGRIHRVSEIQSHLLAELEAMREPFELLFSKKASLDDLLRWEPAKDYLQAVVRETYLYD